VVDVGDDGKIANAIHVGHEPLMQGLSRNRQATLRGLEAEGGRMKNNGTRGCLGVCPQVPLKRVNHKF
jgi:hypothetical protein